MSQGMNISAFNSENVLDHLERDYMINLNIIDMQILIHKIINDFIERAKKEYSEEQIEGILPALEGFASSIIKLTETNLKETPVAKEELERRLTIMSKLFDEENPEKYKREEL